MTDHNSKEGIAAFTEAVKEAKEQFESVLQIAVLKISEGFHCIVTIKVDGKAARMILDTAASGTIFDKKRFNKLVKNAVITNNISKATTAAGEVEQARVDIKELKMDKLVLNDYTVVLMDLAHINDSYKAHKLQPIDGVIGADILVKHKAIIDLSEKELVF